jgi:hypothetical protein
MQPCGAGTLIHLRFNIPVFAWLLLLLPATGILIPLWFAISLLVVMALSPRFLPSEEAMLYGPLLAAAPALLLFCYAIVRIRRSLGYDEEVEMLTDFVRHSLRATKPSGPPGPRRESLLRRGS